MSRRYVKQVTDEVYHVYNRSVASQPIFNNSRECNRFIFLIDFYRFEKPPLRFSHYDRLSMDAKKEFLSSLYETGRKQVGIYAFCLMPNHFHFLLRQTTEDGISSFLRNVQNAYAKYYNKKKERLGSLFQMMFKVVRIEKDEQFTHVARYIHLNPLTSYVLRKPEELENYKWSSFGTYMSNFKYPFVETDFILKLFRSRNQLKEFTYNQVDYQRKLEKIKHLSFE